MDCTNTRKSSSGLPFTCRARLKQTGLDVIIGVQEGMLVLRRFLRCDSCNIVHEVTVLTPKGKYYGGN